MSTTEPLSSIDYSRLVWRTGLQTFKFLADVADIVKFGVSAGQILTPREAKLPLSFKVDPRYRPSELD